MSRNHSRLTASWCALRHVHPVDKSLLFFMLVLLLQSAANLFFPGDASQFTRDIDVIVRTSAAAIFGYFLSASFVRSTSVSGQAPGIQTPHILDAGAEPLSSGVKSRIGFASEESPPEAGGTAEHLPFTDDSGASCLQVTIAASIGLFCLIVLLVLRNLAQWGLISAESDTAAAAVTQFRDFISGCVGFLIGSPTHTSQSAS